MGSFVNMEINKKMIINLLKIDNIRELSKEERKRLLIVLNKEYHLSERNIGKLLGISHSTVHDHISGRQDNTKENIHVSLAMVTRRLKYYKLETKIDVMFFKSIKKIVTEKLKKL